MFRVIRCFIVLQLFCAGTIACSHNAPAPAANTSTDAKGFDRDHDGYIDEAEAQEAFKYLVKKFPALIEDDRVFEGAKMDGELSATEAQNLADALKEPGTFRLSASFKKISVEEFNRRYFFYQLVSEKRSPEYFDRNGDGLIQVDEARLAFSYLGAKDTRDFDVNLDGAVSYDEFNKIKRERETKFDDDVGDWEDGTPIATLRSAFPSDIEDTILGELPDDHWLKKVIIRESVTELSVHEALNPAVSFKTAKPATFSYNRDIHGGGDIWTAQGAILYPVEMEFESEGDSDQLKAVYIMPSFTFNRISNEVNSQDDVDSLVPRITAEFLYTDIGGLFSTQLFRTNLAYGTDSSLSAGVIAGEAQWEPVNNDLGIGTSIKVSPFDELFEFRWRPVGHLVYGHVVDPGNNPQLADEDDFLRAGGFVQFDIFPLGEEFFGLASDRLAFRVLYGYLYGIQGMHRHSQHFLSEMAYQLDESGHFSMSVKYEKGDVAITMEDIDLFSVQLGVKF